MTNTGAIAANLHEGSRSEYLAHYVFASFGTSIPVPRQEDGGVDLYCTLTERVGKLAWPMEHFTVQVKSGPEPIVLGTPDSVGWLIRHPFPLLLCCVDKKALRFSVYHTFPRYQLWMSARQPERLELVPGVGPRGRFVEWKGDERASLDAPILDFSLTELLNPDRHAELKEVLKLWLGIDADNLTQVKLGLRSFSMPTTYVTNALDFTGAITLSRAFRKELGRTQETLGGILPYAANHFRAVGDLPGAALCALLYRRLSVKHGLDVFSVAIAVNKALGLTNDVLDAGLDRLGREFDGLLGLEALASSAHEVSGEAE